ncbi:RDD family protein [Luteimicrobium sp. NPDC057192]|uniref:RDD family protein n=1 Tax=Luteimicrobium sp. NPDC057192 TaxID=3346042 RepID=UPI00363D10DC
MVSRDEIGSWLEGTPGGPSTRGARLGLPPDGPGSLAPLGRRILALIIDWALCWAVSAGFFGGNSWATLLIFLGENVVLVGTAGFTVGHRVLGLRVRRLVADAPDVPPGPLRALVRSVLVCLVIPAVVWDGDGRGLHDRAAGTAIVRR